MIYQVYPKGVTVEHTPSRVIVNVETFVKAGSCVFA